MYFQYRALKSFFFVSDLGDFAIPERDLCRMRDPGGGVRCDLERDDERFCWLDERDAFTTEK